MFGQQKKLKQQPVSFVLDGMQQQGTHFVVDFGTGQLTGKTLIDEIGMGFGCGISSLEYDMRNLRSNFAGMSNRFFPFLNKTWHRSVSYVITKINRHKKNIDSFLPTKGRY